MDADKVKYYFGNVSKCFLGYSNDEKIRSVAASGGMVSSILIYLLENKIVDGVVVSKQVCKNNKIDHEVKIVKTKKDVLDCATSIYFDFPLLGSLDKIKKFKGKLAIVAIPCHIHALRNICNSDKELGSKVKLLVGLFCGHNSKKELIVNVLKKKGINEEDVERVIFRRGHWRGQSQIYMKDGTVKKFPFSHFGTYQNLHFFSKEGCVSCIDHTSEYADISCGDVWMRSMKKKPIKHSSVIARTKEGLNILQQMEKKGSITLEETDAETIFKAQSRSLRFHKNITARSKAGKLLDYQIRSIEGQEVRWNDYLAALIGLANKKFSETGFGKKVIFAVPRPLWYLYLLFFKLLTNF